MSGRGRRGRPKRVIPVVSYHSVVPERDEHLVGSSGPPEGAQVPELFMAELVAQIAHIVATTTRQQSQPPPQPREVLEEPGRSIERVQKLGAKP